MSNSKGGDFNSKKQIKKFESEYIDPYLFKVITIFVAVMHEIKHVKRMDIEEIRIKENFFYCIENLEKNLTGYIGREKHTNKIIFMIIDKGRLNWALSEGFTRNEAFELVGIFRKICGLTDFTNFMSGQDKFTFCGEYFTQFNSCNCEAINSNKIEKKKKAKKTVKKLG